MQVVVRREPPMFEQSWGCEATRPDVYRSILASLRVPPTKKARQKVPAAPKLLHDQATFDRALVAFKALDKAFAAEVLSEGTQVSLRRREPGFEGIASIIVAQQVSTASANAIFGRLKERFEQLEAAALLAASDADLKLCGLSAPKIRTLRAVATAIEVDKLDLAALASTEAEAAHTSLVAIKGIGPWTADVFLLFCLGHADAWPAGDLALQEAARIALDLPIRPTTPELIAIGERWRPLRGVAAHCLWAYYRTARGRAATLDAAPKPTLAPKPKLASKPDAPKRRKR